MLKCCKNFAIAATRLFATLEKSGITKFSSIDSSMESMLPASLQAKISQALAKTLADEEAYAEDEVNKGLSKNNLIIWLTDWDEI